MSSSFYRAVVQVILLYGSETWVILASIAKRIEGMHTEFLNIVTGNRVKILGDGTWEKPGVEVIREAAGTQSDRVCIEQRQATVTQWVALRSLFEVCSRETRYKRGEQRRKAWWRQEAT